MSQVDSNAGASDVLVSFRGVQKSYDGENLIVKDLNLDIRKGEFLTLLGPSGSGKTTSLMMLAGFETPTAGEILLAGRAINNVPPHKRDIGMVFQNYALFPHMTVAENLAFPLTVRGLNKSDVSDKVKKVLSMVQLDAFASRYPAQLSGGQQQRVALARALVFEPQLVLMDEPLGALDKQLREHMQMEIKHLHQRLGVTVVYVTHDQGEALTMSDRIAVMQAGVIDQLGSPREIYERPATRFVAGFIGTSNIVEGQCERAENGLALLSYTQQDRVVVPCGSAVRAGDKIEVSVRPEKIDLHRGVPPVSATGASVLSGVVNEVVYHGTSTNYTVATAAGADFTVFDQNASNAEDLADRGDRVFLTWAPQHSYLIGV